MIGAEQIPGLPSREPSPLVGGEPLAADARHPVLTLIGKRLGAGILTLLLVSVLVFFATEVLPGNAAYAVLGRTATQGTIRAMEARLHLNESVIQQYWHWLSHAVRADFGTSFASGGSVTGLVGPRLADSAVLVVLAGAISTVLGLGLGLLAVWRRDSWIDHVLSVVALAITALPEFVVGVGLVMLLSTIVLHLLPGVSTLAPGQSPFSDPWGLVLPVATLVLVTAPYLFRMSRGALVEALESDYVEMAELKGMSRRRVLLVHALVNSLAPSIQVVGLNLVYLAGGIVIVEYVFNYPGVGQGLVQAVSARDIPTIQFIVMVLATVYVLVNIVTDVLALLVTPRRRLPRWS